ncbi:MAG: glycosyltransferase family 39 protein [Anaerolineae bacterium]|nr:MAG: glycosyltransferase family 39 protein [Anaerolineae bacterium]
MNALGNPEPLVDDRQGEESVSSVRLEPGSWQRKLLLVIGITLVAIFFRLYRIDSLPPGDGYDPAFYGVDALAILKGERPIFLPTNFGREVLFSYLVAACFLVWGIGPLAIHVASAIVGILTVPAVFFAADEMFSAEEGILAEFGGALAALTVAVSYWHLNWSRYGVRAILVPLLGAITFYFLWRGLRRKSRWAFVGCGFFLGLSMYTYQAARLFPLLVLLGFLYVIWAQRSLPSSAVMNLFLVFAIAFAVFAPLGYYFLTHPGSFSERIQHTLIVDTSQQMSSNVRILANKLQRVLLMFSFRGDDWSTVNLPGRPALNPFLSAAFFLGIAISLFRIKKPPYLFLLTWLGVMIVPAILAEQAAMSKRTIGAVPAVAMLVAVGCLVPYDVLLRRADRRPAPWAKGLTAGLAIVIGAGLIFSGALTYRDYFLVWGQDPDLFTHFDAGPDAVGRYIEKLPSDERIYLSPVPPQHPSVVLNSKGRPGTRGYNGRVCLVLPRHAAHNTTYIIVPRDDKNSLGRLREFFPQGGVADEGPLHYQKPYFLAYRVPAGTEAQLEPAYPVEANWGDKIGLLGYDLDASTYEAGETIHLVLYTQALDEMETNYTVFTHLLGPYNPATSGPLWSQDDSEPCRRGYPTSSWDAGEIVADTYSLSIPAETPEGDYQLEMGFYEWPALERLPVLDAAGQVVADNVILGQLHVKRRE